MSYSDELEAIEQERHDADAEQAELEAVGRHYSQQMKRSNAERAAGNLAAAAALCPHGGGYPLNSIAAENENDPRRGQAGVRCSDCGSVLSAFRWNGGRVLIPCDWRKE